MTETLKFPGLGIEIPLSKVAFSIPFSDSFVITVRWYGIIIAVGFILALLYVMKRVKLFGLNADRVIDVIIGGVVGGIIGARLYYVAFTWDYYQDHLDEIIQIWNGGIAIYGGLIGALLAGLLMCVWRKVKILPMLDLVVGGFFIGQGIGRWGNFVNMEAFGTNTTMPWGMTSDSISRYLASVSGDLEKIGVTVDPSMPVHPTFFYESLWCLAGFLVLLWFTKKRRFDGELFLFYTAWYGLGRAFIEGMRTDSLMLGTIRVSQLVAIICVVSAVVVWLVVRGKIRSAHDPEYLKLYALTEESQEVVSGEYYERLKAGKKAEKQPEAEAAPQEEAPTEAGEAEQPEDDGGKEDTKEE